MRHLFLVSVFLFGLMLKVSAIAGVEGEKIVREIAQDASVPVESEPIVDESEPDNQADANVVPDAPVTATHPSSSPSSAAAVQVSNAPAPAVPVQVSNAPAPAVPASAPVSAPAPTAAPAPAVPSAVEAAVPAQPAESNTPTQPASRVAYQDDGRVLAYGRHSSDPYGDASVLTHDQSYSDRYSTRITPMLGTAFFGNGWSRFNVTNSYAFGLGVEFPMSDLISLEAEGGYARYAIAYSLGGPMAMGPRFGGPAVGHNFNQYNLGGNLKVYLAKRVIRPYVGAGLQALYYDNMLGMMPGLMGPAYFGQWLGAGQLLAGADIEIARGVSIGARGGWIIPIINPGTSYNMPYSASPESSLINTSYYKLMGEVTFAL